MWWFGGIWCHKVLASNPLMNKSNDNVQTSRTFAIHNQWVQYSMLTQRKDFARIGSWDSVRLLNLHSGIGSWDSLRPLNPNNGTRHMGSSHLQKHGFLDSKVDGPVDDHRHITKWWKPGVSTFFHCKFLEATSSWHEEIIKCCSRIFSF